MEKINLFIDESGDLGIKGERYFLISAIEIDDNNLKGMNRRAGRTINRYKERNNISKNTEIKGSLLKRGARIDLLSSILYKDVHVRYIVLDIQRTTILLKKADDKNACYNYLIQLIVRNVLKDYPEIEFINLYLDNCSVKIGNRLSLKPYLYNKLVFEQMEVNDNVKRVEFNVNYLESEACYLIQWVDIIANSLYKKYTNKSSEFYNIIKPFIVYESWFPSKNFGK
jgi:hypothetical protein